MRVLPQSDDVIENFLGDHILVVEPVIAPGGVAGAHWHSELGGAECRVHDGATTAAYDIVRLGTI